MKRDRRIGRDLMAAYEVALARFGPRENVTGVDIGLKHTGHHDTGVLAIRIHVREKLEPGTLRPEDTFPKEIDGVPIDVIQGHYKPLASRKCRLDPVRPGCSIGPEGGDTGTLGMFVKDKRTGEPALLSCGHVLFSTARAGPGDRVLQPSPDDGGRPDDLIAEIERQDRTTDAAIARLISDRETKSRAIDVDKRIRRFRFPKVGDVLVKSGRSSGLTKGKVDGLGHIAGLAFAISIRPLDDDNRDPIAVPGDSGAIWYDPKTFSGVGLHCKGERIPTSGQSRAVATSLAIIEDRLDIKP